MAPGKGNESGHWESQAVADFNDALLESAGLSWGEWTPFTSAWRCSPKMEQFKDRACALFDQEFADSRLFVLKDPRICRLAPIWLDAMDRMGITPALVLPVRDPVEVGASLQARDGTNPNVGHLLWLRYVLEAEASTRGRPRYFCSYADLMTDWSKLVRGAEVALDIKFPRSSKKAELEIQDFLSTRNWHQRRIGDSAADEFHAPTWLRDTFKILSGWTTFGEQSSDFAELDRIRTEFDLASPHMAPLASAVEHLTQAVGDLDAQRGRLIAERDDAVGHLMARLREVEGCASEEKLGLRAEIEALQGAIVQRDDIVARAEAERLELTIRFEAIERALAVSETKASEAAQGAELLKAALSERDEAAARASAERDRLEALVETLDQALGASEAQATELAKSHAEEIARLTQLLRSAEAATEEASTLRLRHAEQESALAATEARAHELESQVTESKRWMAEAEGRLNDAFGEIAAVSRLLRDAELTAGRAVGEAEWTRKIAAFFVGESDRPLSRIRMLAPPLLLRPWVMRELKRRGWFDAQAYLRAHPDVERARVDALRHYLNCGIKEGRRRGE
jgi:hypothetical protein